MRLHARYCFYLFARTNGFLVIYSSNMNYEHCSRPKAWERAADAEQLLRPCVLCPHACAVDRTTGHTGVCGAGYPARVFLTSIDWTGEEPLTPGFVVHLSGCNLKCGFCITGETSQNPLAGMPLDIHEIQRLVCATAPRVKSIVIEGGEPSVNLPDALRIASIIPTDKVLVWKTNAWCSPDVVAALDGIPDIYLADLKFGNDACASRLAGIEHYVDTVMANLILAQKQMRVIVRHLLLPGHWDCCFVPVAQRLAREMPDCELSIMSGFHPVFRSTEFAELNRLIRCEEVQSAREYAAGLRLNLAQWVLRPGEDVTETVPDEIWIDRQGRLCAGLASGPLAGVLEKLSAEFRME